MNIRKALFLFFIALLFSVDASASKASSQKVTVILKWFYQYQFAGIIMAKEKGFYQKEGLDVTILERDPAKDHIKQVLNGEAEYGIADSSLVRYALDGAPVKIIAPIFQHNAMVIISKKSSGITSPYELIGKKISYQEGIDDAIFSHMFRFADMTSKDYTKMPMDFSYEKFISGDIDVIAAYITDQPHWIEKRGVSLNIINPISYGVDLYGDILFTNADEVAAHPQRVMAMKEATLEGWKYALDHPDETINVILQKYNTRSILTRDQLEYEAKTTKHLIDAAITPLGTINPIRLASIVRTYQYGITDDKVAQLVDSIVYDPEASDQKYGKYWKMWAVVAGLMILIIAALIFNNRRLNYLVAVRTRYLEEAKIEAESAARAKQEFLSNMSHEIRTPLNAILGFVHILEKRDLDPDSKKYLKIILNSGDLLLNIIGDILDFSKISNHKLAIEVQPFNPLTEFGNTLLLFSSNAAEKQIEYLTFIDPELPQCFEGDSLRIKQILSNLLSNAVKFTPEKGSIRVKIHYIEESGILECAIKDSGIGMSDEQQKRIFNAFEQSDASTTRKFGGTGLGLAITAALAELMGGEIQVTSQIDKGSLFVIRLPIKPCILPRTSKRSDYGAIRYRLLPSVKENRPYLALCEKYLQALGAAEAPSREEATLLVGFGDDLSKEMLTPSLVPHLVLLKEPDERYNMCPGLYPILLPLIPGSLMDSLDALLRHTQAPPIVISPPVNVQGHILVAEDNPVNQILMEAILDDYALTYDIAGNGREAVELYRQNRYDLILMDEQMPELNGVEALRQIREFELLHSRPPTPVIAVTANALNEDRKRLLEAGMDDFISKPIENESIEPVLIRYLSAQGT